MNSQLCNLVLYFCLIIATLEIVIGLEDTYYNTTSGEYQARLIEVLDTNNNNITSFLHRLEIPYAEKPERFKEAVIKQYVSGKHNYTKPVVCYQSVHMTSYGLFNIQEAPEMSEDCLRVTLYIPVNRTNMSVVVHIHGGSNMVGGSALFDGSILAAHGQVVVAIINYRLSILGFLSDLTAKYPGNNGLRDQVLAIKWIKQNCATLRCNPNSITLWGHSAGAGDVNLLALSPFSNHLFHRAIIQSGSAFAYWSYDKHHTERYHSYRTYFNCTHLPEKVTRDNKALTLLIEDCLLNATLEKLFEFRYALIDSPGPIKDDFLDPENSIMYYSPQEMLLNANENFYKIDILTGINRVEGYAFEGYFSTSVNNWRRSVNVPEIALTLERYSILLRDKCMQNSIVNNRIKFDDYYQSKLRPRLNPEEDQYNFYSGRLKSIFANSDSIFDAGFIGFLKSYYELKLKNNNSSGLFVYEYLHENAVNKQNLNHFKKFLKDNYSMSTHFDGIDLVFGLPVAYRFTHKNLNLTSQGKHVPYENFSIDTTFSLSDYNLSIVMMTYFSNFVKTGDPNLGYTVPKKWQPYSMNGTYFKINLELLNSTTGLESSNSENIREDLYNFWHLDLEKNSKCSNSIQDYESYNHTNGVLPKLDKCFEHLDNSSEYVNLRENFLIEYETCMNRLEGSPNFSRNSSLRNLFNTHCLDAIAVRRLLIEHELCCNNNVSSKNTQAYSTVCDFNLTKSYLNHKVVNLAEIVLLSSSYSPPVSSSSHLYKFYFLGFIITEVFFYFLYKFVFK